jgi:predicted Zn-dependent peptidase
MFKKTTLKNGLRIITVPQKGTKAVTVLVLVATGSKYEKKEINGISHFLEHMFFKGTKKRPTPITIAEPLDRVGGIYNAFTGEEYTGYFAKVDAKHFDLALDVISDIYLNSKLDSKEIKKEKRVIIEEINMYYDHPSSYVQSLWNKVLYGDQPAGRDIAGTKESVSKISRKQLADYMKTQYTASNTIVCIAGNISKNVEAKAKRYFSKINIGNIIEKPLVIEKQTQPESLVNFKNTDQTHFCLGVRGYNLFHAHRFTLELLGLILGGMMSSRLFIKVREELGLAYYVKTGVSSDPDTGCLVTQAGVDNKRAGKAISAVLKEYKRISQNKISSKELKKAKDHFKGKMSLFFEASDARASFYALQELLENKILRPEEIYAKINKVSVNDILKVSKDIFQPQKLNLALIGPFKDKTKFQKLLWIKKNY